MRDEFGHDIASFQGNEAGSCPYPQRSLSAGTAT